MRGTFNCFKILSKSSFGIFRKANVLHWFYPEKCIFMLTKWISIDWFQFDQRPIKSISPLVRLPTILTSRKNVTVIRISIRTFYRPIEKKKIKRKGRGEKNVSPDYFFDLDCLRCNFQLIIVTGDYFFWKLSKIKM